MVRQSWKAFLNLTIGIDDDPLYSQAELPFSGSAFLTLLFASTEHMKKTTCLSTIGLIIIFNGYATAQTNSADLEFDQWELPQPYLSGKLAETIKIRENQYQNLTVAKEMTDKSKCCHYPVDQRMFISDWEIEICFPHRQNILRMKILPVTRETLITYCRKIGKRKK